MKLAPFGGTHVAIALTIGFAALIPACGGDDNGNGAGGGAGTGGTTGTGGGTGTGGSVGTGGTTGTGGSAGTGGNRDASTGMGGTSGAGGSGGAAGTGGATGAGGAAEGGTGGGLIGDGGGDAAAETGGFPNPCFTTFLDGGGQVLWSFTDNGSSVGWQFVFADTADSGQTASLGNNTSDGHSCPGALQLTVPFSSFGDVARIVIRYASPPPVWNGTRLHLWAKVSTSNYAALNGLQPFIQATGVQADGGLGADYSIGFYTPTFASINPTFADGGWHEVVVPLLMTDPNADGGDAGLIGIGGINAFGVQLLTQGLLADGGAPGAPPTATTLLIDDIWLE